jgi:hypothetical protein
MGVEKFSPPPPPPEMADPPPLKKYGAHEWLIYLRVPK